MWQPKPSDTPNVTFLPFSSPKNVPPKKKEEKTVYVHVSFRSVPFLFPNSSSSFFSDRLEVQEKISLWETRLGASVASVTSSRQAKAKRRLRAAVFGGGGVQPRKGVEKCRFFLVFFGVFFCGFFGEKGVFRGSHLSVFLFEVRH